MKSPPSSTIATNETTPLLHNIEYQVIYYGGDDDDLHNNEEEEQLSQPQEAQLPVVTTSPQNYKKNKEKKRSNSKLLSCDNCTFMTLLAFFFLAIHIWHVWTKPTTTTMVFDVEKINTLISFGDSYTTRYLDMNTLTYACRNCTSAGGPNYIIYLEDAMNWISWDFAYNSAPVYNSIVNQTSSVIDMSTQIHNLYPLVFVSPTEQISTIVQDKYKEADKVRTPESTLTTLWVGINDIDLTFDWQDTDTLDLLIMQYYQALINELYEKGVNQFMLINVPPIDRAPMWHKTSHESLIQHRVQVITFINQKPLLGFNQKLTNMVHQLKKNHPEALFLEYDAWSFFNQVMDHANQYDLTDIDTYCPDWSHPVERGCKPIGEYFWLNDLHPTFHVHQWIAKDIEKFLSNQ